MVARIAVSSNAFAVMDDGDWGHAYYLCGWEFAAGVVRGTGKNRETRLDRLIADRLGLDRTISVGHRNDDPLDCRRCNLYPTKYVWVKGVIRRCVTEDDGQGGYREEPGWLFGNVGLSQWAGDWGLIHLPTGLYCGASWPRVADAKEGVELIHAECDLAELDEYASMTPDQGRKWRDVINKRRNQLC